MRRYLIAATLARAGDEMVAFTLVLLVLERTGRAGLAGLAAGAYAFPAVLTGPLLGTWLDRTTRRRTALALNQAVLGVTVLGLLGVVGHAPVWVTPLLAAVAGITLPMVSGGFSSMLPALVPAGRLPRANSLDAASFGLATICAPGTAATVAAVASVEAAAVTIVGVAALSVLAIGRLPVVPPTPVAGGFLGSVVDGLRHLLRTPPLRGSTVASTLALGATGALMVTLPIHVAGLGRPAATSGYLWTAFEIGSVLTALLAGHRLARWRPERVVAGAVAAAGLSVLSWPLAPGFGVLIALAAVTGLIEGAMMPAMLTARQVYSPPELQARVSTTAASLRLGVMAIGQVLGGLLVPVAGTSAVLFGVGGVLIAGAGLGLVSAGQSRMTERVRPRG